MKIFKIIFVLLIFLLLCGKPIFADNKNWVVDKSQNIVTILSVNDKEFFDSEIFVCQNGEVLLPFKYIADILEIKYTQNHLTKQIDFTTDSGQKIVLDPKNNKNIKYLKKGLMDETVDEVFIDSALAEKVFDAKIKVDKNDLSIYLNTSKKLAVLDKNEEIKMDDTGIKTLKAYTQVVIPEKKRKISLDTIEFDNNTRTDTVKELYILNQNNNLTFDNASMLALKGKAFDGDYKVDFSTYANNTDAFSFGSIGFNYKNSIKGYDCEIGKILGWDNIMENDLIGFKADNFKDKISSYRDIKGYVSQDSTVNVIINAQPFASLSTYGGYYDLKELPAYNGRVKSVAVEEQKADGSKKIVFSKEFHSNEEFILKGEKKYGFITGMSGLNNRLWSQNGYVYESTAKKLVAGFRVKQGLTDKLTLDSSFLKDSILSKGQNSLWGTQFLNNNNYLNFSNYRNTNTISGETFLNSLNYMLSDNMRLTANIGFSDSKDISASNKNRYGKGADICFSYQKPAYDLKIGLFNYEPDYYIAGNDSFSFVDKKGAYISGNFKIRSLNLNTKYSRYNSNLNNRLNNGVITFNELSFGANAPVTKTSRIIFNINAKNGENQIGKLSSFNYNLNFSKRLSKNIVFEAGKQSSRYDSKYFSQDKSNDNYLSVLNTSYTKIVYNMPKNIGSLELSNDAVNMKSGTMNNNYYIARIGYTFPEIGGILSSINTGYRYKGSNGGLDFSATLGYRFKSGRIISVNYQFNRNLGYILDDMFIPSNSRHSININLNDVMAFVDGGLKSVGIEGDNKGFIEPIAFLDLNKDGKRDKDELEIENISLKTNWQNDAIYTGKKRKNKIQSVAEGIYNINLDNDNLPALLSLSPAGKENFLVKIEKNKKTKIEFPLISSVGNIKGTVNISDSFNRNIDIKDLVVVIYDSSGKEIAYTTVNDDKSFMATGLSPGEYTLQLDKDYMELYNLRPYNDSGIIKIRIPAVYEEYVDINNINLKYICD